MLLGQVIVQAEATVTVNEQLPELPDVSLAEQVTVVTPTEKLVPEAGVQETGLEPSQASVAVAENVAIAEPEPTGLSVRLIGDGQLTVGPWLSATVTVKLHELPLPNVSEAEQVTVVTPFGKLLPEAGEHVTARAPSQASLAVGAVYVATAVHNPAAVLSEMLLGQAVNAGP